MATLEELAGLAALIAGSRYQNKQVGKANRIKLEQMRQEQDLQRQRFEAQKKAQEREQALQEANPFLQVFTASDSADRLANMGQQGTLESFLRSAGDVFNRAGIPFDLGTYWPKRPTGQGVDLSGVGMGSQAPPVGAPADGVFARPQGMEAPGTPVPRFNQLPPDMAGPPTPIANLPDERLRLLFGGLPGGMQGPPTPVSAMRPEPAAPSTPPAAVQPFDMEEALREKYQPGVLTQAKIGRMIAQNADLLAKQGVYDSTIEKNAAITETTRLMAQPKVRLMLAQIGYTEERAQTEALLRDATVRQRLAAAANLEDMPGSRARADQTRRFGIETSAETADEDREARAVEGAANRQSRESVAAKRAANQTNKVPAEQQATYRKYLDIVTAEPGTNPISGLQEEKHTPEEVASARSGLMSMGKRYRIDLSGIPGGKDFSAAAPAPSRDSGGGASSGLSDSDRSKVAAYIRAGSFGTLMSAVKDPKARKAVMAEYRRQTGKVWGGN